MSHVTSNRRCAYCGSENASTDGHVPPTALYPPSKAASRVQRITVPACLPCNGSFTNDEVHFRNILQISGDPTPIVRELWEGKTRRSFEYVDGRRRARDMLDCVEEVETSRGWVQMVFPGRDPRVMRVVRKIVRGLCHHHGLLSPVSDDQVWYDVQRFELAPRFLTEFESAHVDPDIHSGWLLRFFTRTPLFCVVYRSVEARRRVETASTLLGVPISQPTLA